jgi:hypothetical protein
VRKYLGLIALLAFIVPSAVRAQTCNLINNCPAAVSPQAGDEALTWQLSQFPHTRKMTLSQIIAGGMSVPLTGKLTALPSSTGSAGFNLGNGVAPISCLPGDVWTTGAGLFSCVNGHAVGPYGTGGSVLPVYADASALPAVTASNAGSFGFVSNCPNGSQSGNGATGCPYVVDSTGTWTALPYPPSTTITVGGQALFLGGATNNQGNGTKVQLANGGFVAGNALVYDINGNAVNGGVPPSGGTGGAGTVANGAVNAVPFYPSAGTTVAGLTVVPNAVLATNASGVPSEATTLPPALIIPAPTISAATLTGTTSAATVNMTGKLTTVASTTGAAGLNIAPGVAPSAPANGDEWVTTTGKFTRVNGTSQGPYIYTVGGTTPIVITGGGTPLVTATCPTCALTTNGGALSGTSPISISAAGVISLGAQPGMAVWIADSATTVHNDTYNLIEKWLPANSGTIQSIVYHTGGTNTPTFTVSLQIAGTPVTGCNGLGVSSSSDTTTTCTAANTIINGQSLGLVITGVSGSPASAVVQVNFARPAS